MPVFTALRNKARSTASGFLTKTAQSALGLNRATGLRFNQPNTGPVTGNAQTTRGGEVLQYPLDLGTDGNSHFIAFFVKQIDPAEAEKEFNKYKAVRDAYEEKGQELGVYARSESITFNGKKYKAIKESVNKRITVKEVHTWLKSLEEFRYRKIPNVDARRITSFVNNGLSETDLPQSLQKKWGSAKYSKEKGLADRFIKQRISQKLTQNESKHPIKEQYDRLFTNRVIL